MPEILTRAGHLAAAHPRDGDPIRYGRVHIAPPDHHMVIDHETVRIVHGPSENGVRPSIDPLFRSAARTYGSRVTGVVLTGALDDGTAGLAAVKEAGGIAIVQDPEEAFAPSMPRSAMAFVNVDHVLPLRQIAPLLDEARDGGNAGPEAGQRWTPRAAARTRSRNAADCRRRGRSARTAVGVQLPGMSWVAVGVERVGDSPVPLPRRARVLTRQHAGGADRLGRSRVVGRASGAGGAGRPDAAAFRPRAGAEPCVGSARVRRPRGGGTGACRDHAQDSVEPIGDARRAGPYGSRNRTAGALRLSPSRRPATRPRASPAAGPTAPPDLSRNQHHRSSSGSRMPRTRTSRGRRSRGRTTVRCSNW